MTTPDTTPPGGTPPAGKLLRSTLLAAAVASVLLVTVVLPAEYGIDPTGVGRVIGLTRMGEIKMSLAREVAAAEAAEAAAQGSTEAEPGEPTAALVTESPDELGTGSAGTDASTGTEVTRISLAPDQGKELKLVMRKGARVDYAWSTDRGVVNYDAHGDSTNVPRSYFSYGKGSGVASDEGILTAQFDGKHGWFWRNRSRDSITITLRVSGEYQEIQLPR